MNSALQADLTLVSTTLAKTEIPVRFQAFGSASNGLPSGSQDIDMALIVDADKKVATIEALRRLGPSGQRRMNWRIDIFDNALVDYGYNHSRHPGWLHWLVISRDEADGNSALAKSIRRTSSMSVQDRQL